MGNAENHFVGTDVGASRTKLAVLDSRKQLCGYAVRRSGTDFSITARRCLDEALAMAGIDEVQITNSFSTGYGRKNVTFANDSRTEESGAPAAGVTDDATSATGNGGGTPGASRAGTTANW